MEIIRWRRTAVRLCIRNSLHINITDYIFLNLICRIIFDIQ